LLDGLRTGGRLRRITVPRFTPDALELLRESALPLLPRFETSASEPALRAAIADLDPLVRLAAPRALTQSASQATLLAAASLLRDPVRAVRIEAARAFPRLWRNQLNLTRPAQ
jgi:hypothetical protein